MSEAEELFEDIFHELFYTYHCIKFDKNIIDEFKLEDEKEALMIIQQYDPTFERTLLLYNKEYNNLKDKCCHDIILLGNLLLRDLLIERLGI